MRSRAIRAPHVLAPSSPTTNSLAREELKFLLDEIGDVEVVATAANGLEALEAIEKLDPAVAFLDIQMPGLDGLASSRRLRERADRTSARHFFHRVRSVRGRGFPAGSDGLSAEAGGARAAGSKPSRAPGASVADRISEPPAASPPRARRRRLSRNCCCAMARAI